MKLVPSPKPTPKDISEAAALVVDALLSGDGALVREVIHRDEVAKARRKLFRVVVRRQK